MMFPCNPRTPLSPDIWRGGRPSVLQQREIPRIYHYVCFSISPSTEDTLTLRKILQDALASVFGSTRSGAYLDLLWVNEDGSEMVVRIGNAYVPTFQVQFAL